MRLLIKSMCNMQIVHSLRLGRKIKVKDKRDFSPLEEKIGNERKIDNSTKKKTKKNTSETAVF